MPGGSALPPGCFFSDAVKMAPHSSSSSCWCGLSRWILPCLHLLDESSAEPLNFFPGRTLGADQGCPQPSLREAGQPRCSLRGSPRPPPSLRLSPTPLQYFNVSSQLPEAVPRESGLASATHRAVPPPRSAFGPLRIRGALSGGGAVPVPVPVPRPVTPLPLAPRPAVRGGPCPVCGSAPRAVLGVCGTRAIPDRKPGAAGGPPSPGRVQPWLLGSSCRGSSPGGGKQGRFGSPLGAHPAPAGEGAGTPPGWLSPSAPHQAAAGLVLCNNPRSSQPLLSLRPSQGPPRRFPAPWNSGSQRAVLSPRLAARSPRGCCCSQPLCRPPALPLSSQLLGHGTSGHSQSRGPWAASGAKAEGKKAKLNLTAREQRDNATTETYLSHTQARDGRNSCDNARACSAAAAEPQIAACSTKYGNGIY